LLSIFKTLHPTTFFFQDEFYSHADGLIGVCPDNLMGADADCLISKVLSLDLRPFPKERPQ
jgi:hypothetical protein